MIANLRMLVAGSFLLCSLSELRADYVYSTFDVPGATSTSLTGINNLGQIVGNYSSVTTSGTFFYDGQNFVSIGTRNYLGLGLNDSGTVIGLVLGTPDGYPTNFEYRNGNVTQVGNQNFLYHVALVAINNAGQLTGDFMAANFFQGILVDGNTATTLDVPDFTFPACDISCGPWAFKATGINNVGQILGVVADVYGLAEVGLFENGAFNPLPSFPGAPTGINDTDQIVGYYGVGSNSFLYDRGNITPIAFPGAASTSAAGINNAGDIVGNYTDSRGINHGFIATPSSSAPEPASAGLAVIGLLLFVPAVLKRRRLSAVRRLRSET